MADLLANLELSDTLERAPFTELHLRTIDRPIHQVWPACLDVTAREVRTLGPLMALRSLPSRLSRNHSVAASAPRALLDVFADEHFVLLRRDDRPREGRALVLFGAAGQFWSLTANAPKLFDGAEAFLAFDSPGFAKTVARLEAIDLGDGRTRIETETWVAGTDAASTRKFAPYWKLIRYPSGLIRRSWLAAIERRVVGR